MTIKEQLIAAKALIDTSEKWGQGAFILDDGRICASEAIRQATEASYGLAPATKAYLAVSKVAGTAVCDFNDSHTHIEVMALFDRAIAEQV